MKRSIKQIICFTIVGLMVLSTHGIASSLSENNNNEINENSNTNTDNKSKSSIDGIDYHIIFTVKEIRALDKIDFFSDPDFYVKVFINDKKYESPCWENQKYVKEEWSTGPVDVPDDEQNVSIKIQLWDKNDFIDKLCDISSNVDQRLKDQKDIDLIYNLRSGHWRGEDFIYPIHNVPLDVSGYGRLNGCDDNSIYQRDGDCELLFDITQNDIDGDGIPYWTEVNIFETDPEVDDTGRDDDNDGVPIEWEYKWGHFFVRNWHSGTYESYWQYHPFIEEDHANLDPDEDGLQNTEEYLTSQWGSDPFRQDIFLEIDQMVEGPNGEGEFVPEASKEYMRDAFAKYNIFFQLDDGWMGGGEKTIPFDYETNGDEMQQLYREYFLHNDFDNWRRGVFHYGLIVYKSPFAGAFCWTSDVNHCRRTDSILVATLYHEDPFEPYWYFVLRHRTTDRNIQHEIAYASLIMHETGHTLGIYRSNTPGCDNRNSICPGSEWLKYRGYRSCMNYNHVYSIVDYSDGSRGKNDFDDWARINLQLFEEDR